jgi:DNA-binding protein H-NS
LESLESITPALEPIAKATHLRGRPIIVYGLRAAFLMARGRSLARPCPLHFLRRPAIRAARFSRPEVSVCGSGPVVWKTNMTSNDLERMSIEELWALHVEISNVLAGKIATEKRQLERRLGMLQATSRSSPSAWRERRPYPQVFPKYRNPSKPSETWAGRGKLPRWLKAELQSGKKIDDFRINNPEYRSTRRSSNRQGRS